jgi:hypothetical protein
MGLACQAAFALQIVKPGEGDKVYAGTTMEVIVEPQPGEDWKEFILQLSPLKDQVFSDGYRETIEIPADLVGDHYLTIAAVDRSGQVLLLQRKILILMPAEVTLKGLSVFPEHITLYKMSKQCPPADRFRFENEELGVYGSCSDGIRRDLTSSASGTTYVIGDKDVASVSAEGVITAKGVGTTTITVVNGASKAKTSVVVKPCKKR